LISGSGNSDPNDVEEIYEGRFKMSGPTQKNVEFPDFWELDC